MRRVAGCLILILGLSLGAPYASAQTTRLSFEHWHTGGAGLSTPFGFNVGATYNVVVKGPLFVQVHAGASLDPYITKHSLYALGPAVGLRRYAPVTLASLSVGPAYIRGSRGADLPAPGASYQSAALTVTGQLLFRELNMGVEAYTTLNPIRNVSGVRMIYRLGRIR